MKFPPIGCRNCRRHVRWPRWRRVAHGEHIPLCWRCFASSTLIVALARQAALLEKASR
jgi:hypothetical protein